MMPIPQGWEEGVRSISCKACVAVPGNRLVLFFRRLSPERKPVSNFVTTYNLDAKSWSMVDNVAGLDDVYPSGYGSTIRAHAVEDVVFLGTQSDMSMSMSLNASITFAMQSNGGLAGRSWCAALRSQPASQRLPATICSIRLRDLAAPAQGAATAQPQGCVGRAAGAHGRQAWRRPRRPQLGSGQAIKAGSPLDVVRCVSL